ncbi:MAG: S9 family peptidase [Phycisphaerae bacterium]|nr:S9 family peptidase [Phycisphaerae bacterium]
MYRRVLAAVVVAVAPFSFVLAAERGPATDATISQFLKIRVPGSVRLAPDGSVYTRDFPDGIFQLYRRNATDPVATQGKRLTDFPDGLSSFSISPDGKWVTLAAAAGGNENNQISLLDPSNDTIKPVLQNPKVQYSVNAWLRDSSGFIYTANDPSPRDFYLYRYDLKSGQSTQLLGRTGQWSCADVTNDGQRLLVVESRSISDTSMYVLDAATGHLTDLTAKGSEATSANDPIGFTANEKEVFFGSDFENGIVQLYTRDASDPTRPPKAFLPGLKDKDLDGAEMNFDRSLIATVHNEDGYGKMRAFYLPEPAAVPMISPPDSVVSVNQIEGMNLVYTVSNSTTPGITFVQEIPPKTEKMMRAPEAINARLDSEPIDLSAFRLPQLIKFKSFDGVEIPAFLYLPAGASKGTPIPFVVNFHGGPEGQFRPGFDRTVQFLVSKGYGVLQPNVRGSTGYGREFHMMDNYKKRWDSVKDGAEAARWLVKEGYAEKGRIAAYGGSYGGFMSVATIIEGSDVFGASINVVGIVNMKTFLEQTSGYRQKLREVEYGPLSDPEFLLSVSPIKRIDEIKVPMMIAHGANDPRVPVGEAMQLAVALQKRGDDPELLFFADEGHGFAKLENRILFSERMVKFLDKHIGPGRLKP